jgi:uncharacterized membrane protein
MSTGHAVKAAPESQPRGPVAPDTAPNGAHSTAIPRKQRILGVDVARGVALLGMMAAHSFDTFNSDGTPTISTMVAAGRSATTFVLIAGVGLALISGGRTVVQGRERTVAAAGLAVRAVLIGVLGLTLGLLSRIKGITEDPILPFYGLLFLLAIPLLGLSPLMLAGVAVAAIVLGPVLLVATADAGLPYAGFGGDPVPATLLHDPLGLLVRLSVTGEYPVVVYIAYLCAGLAIGRLDLTSRRLAWWLLGAGAALAVTARVVSLIVLYPLGGLAHLTSQGSSANTAAALLWDHPNLSSSWWYLALPAPHSHTPVDVTHTLGSAMAVLGAALLLTRVPAIARLLWPLAIAGSMVLTLYSAHLVVIATGVLQDTPVLLYVLMVVGALAFALLWRRWFGQGPLERIVAVASGRARRITAELVGTRTSGTSPSNNRRHPVSRNIIGGAGQFLRPLTVAAALALAFWAGTRSAPTPIDLPQPAVAADQTAGDQSNTGRADPTPTPSQAGAVPAPPLASAASSVSRYCQLSAQVDNLNTLYPDQPKLIVEKGTPQLNEMAQAAPTEIRAAVTIEVEHIRADGGVPGAISPDAATLDRAETTVDTFEQKNCTG